MQVIVNPIREEYLSYPQHLLLTIKNAILNRHSIILCLERFNITCVFTKRD